jgi:lipopolysaccharide transport system permease protein
MNKFNRFLTLTWALVCREITTRYRRSILGPLWAIIQPLVLMLVFTLLRGVINIPSEGVPYVIFSYSALVPWTFFTSSINRCGPSILSNGSLIKKIDMPREVFPLSAIATSFFDFMMSGIVLAGMMIYFKVPLTIMLLWLPILLLTTSILAFGIGMFIASVGCFKRDIIIATPFLAQIWLFATPVIYPSSSVPAKWIWLYKINPMVGIIEGFRNVLVKGQGPNLELLSLSLVITLFVLLFSWPLFRWLSQYFADVL